MSIVSVRSDWR